MRYFVLLLCGVGVLCGCKPAGGSGSASEKDKANIERLAKEGVGAPKSAADEAK